MKGRTHGHDDFTGAGAAVRCGPGVTFEQAREANRLAGEMVQARKEAEKAATGAAALQAKAETAKAELEAMKAEITYRVAHAQLAALVCEP